MTFPFFFIMVFLVVLGSFLSLSSVSWFGVWAGLELNLLCFLPIVVHLSSFLNIEGIVKYFLIQSFGSVGVLSSGLFEDSLVFGSFSFYFFILCFSLFLKIGVFPVHWWVPGVFSSLGWFGIFFLSTWQKVAPVLVFSGVASGSFVFILFSVFSSFLGGIMGVGQTSVRLVLSFSSISHSGWFVSLFCVSWFFGFIYFLVYLFGTIFLVLYLWFFDYSRISQSFIVSFFVCMVFFSCVLSIAGIPPFLGFFSKMLGFMCFGGSFMSMFYLSFLVLGSLFSLYFYLGLFFSCFFFFFTYFIIDYHWSKFLVFWSFLVWFVVVGFFFLDYFFLLMYDILV